MVEAGGVEPPSGNPTRWALRAYPQLISHGRGALRTAPTAAIPLRFPRRPRGIWSRVIPLKRRPSPGCGRSRRGRAAIRRPGPIRYWRLFVFPLFTRRGASARSRSRRCVPVETVAPPYSVFKIHALSSIIIPPVRGRSRVCDDFLKVWTWPYREGQRRSFMARSSSRRTSRSCSSRRLSRCCLPRARPNSTLILPRSFR